MPSIFGPLLSGIGKGLQDYSDRQEDLTYLRQERADKLQSDQLMNQQRQLQIQGIQQQQKDEALARQEALKNKAAQDQTSIDLAQIMAGKQPGQALSGAAQQGLPDPRALPMLYQAPKEPVAGIDKINTLEKAGVDVTPQQVAAVGQQEQKEIGARNQLAQRYRAEAAQYASLGTPEGKQQASAKMQQADALTQQAAALQKSQQEMQGKALDVQEKDLKNKDAALKSVRERMRDVTSQKDYSTVLREITTNPALAAAARSANLTGNFNEDRPKIAKLVQDTETLAQQQQFRNEQARLGIEGARLNIAKQAEQRDAFKFQQEQVGKQVALQEDQKRAADLQQKGIPFTASLQTKFPGANPKELQSMRMFIAKSREAEIEKTDTSMKATQKLQSNVEALSGMLNKGFATGGVGGLPGVRQAMGAFSDQAAQFDKLANDLVVQMQAEAGGNSSKTAAMARVFASTKPSREIPENANRAILANLKAVSNYMGAQQKFVMDFLRNNPDATKADANLQWSRYENTLGPSTLIDPKSPGGYKINPKYENIDPESFFRENP